VSRDFRRGGPSCNLVEPSPGAAAAIHRPGDRLPRSGRTALDLPVLAPARAHRGGAGRGGRLPVLHHDRPLLPGRNARGRGHGVLPGTGGEALRRLGRARHLGRLPLGDGRPGDALRGPWTRPADGAPRQPGGGAGAGRGLGAPAGARRPGGAAPAPAGARRGRRGGDRLLAVPGAGPAPPARVYPLAHRDGPHDDAAAGGRQAGVEPGAGPAPVVLGGQPATTPSGSTSPVSRPPGAGSRSWMRPTSPGRSPTWR
jgi:hypothetical protein